MLQIRQDSFVPKDTTFPATVAPAARRLPHHHQANNRNNFSWEELRECQHSWRKSPQLPPEYLRGGRAGRELTPVEMISILRRNDVTRTDMDINRGFVVRYSIHQARR